MSDFALLSRAVILRCGIFRLRTLLVHDISVEYQFTCISHWLQGSAYTCVSVRY